MTLLPIVDISRYQFPTDFNKMKAAGVAGVILRVDHGGVIDKHVAEMYPLAKAAFGNDVAFYSFMNPKRGSALETSAKCVANLKAIGAPADCALMMDIEAYLNESPAGPELSPAQNAAYLKAWQANVKKLLPKVKIFHYSNAGYYDASVKDKAFAAAGKWVVPRYVVYSEAGYRDYPLPASPAQWEAWVRQFNKEPHAPTGATGRIAFQFSAGYNKQAARYGCSGTDLDLNLFDKAAWDALVGNTAPVAPKPVVKPPVAPKPKPVAPKPAPKPKPAAPAGPPKPRTDLGSWRAPARGQRVKDAQTLLNELGYNLKVDGYAGVGGPTDKAVRAFQTNVSNRYEKGLPIDGICGPRTWAWLFRLARKQG